MNLIYTTKQSGISIPVQIRAQRTHRGIALAHQIDTATKRNNWCTHKKPCSQFGMRPCCPPKVSMFEDFPYHEYLYLIMVRMNLEDYFEQYPQVNASKSRIYFGLDSTHKMTRNISNAIVKPFNSPSTQCFRVGGCLGCKFPKTGSCMQFFPPLEATGINVCSLTKAIFDTEIEWAPPKSLMKTMTAVGAIYTSKQISRNQIEEAILNVCTNR